MINLEDCIELGFISKPTGIKGQVNIRLSVIDFENIIKLEQVFVIIDGLPVPFFIETVSEKSDGSLIVKFDSIDSEMAARKLSDSTLFISKKYIAKVEPKGVENIHQFQGFLVEDINQGPIGILEMVIDNVNNPLMLVTNNTKEYYIPLHEDFFVSIDPEAKIIVLDCPAGLLEIND